MTLNLHHLRLFASVAELGGFSRAASALRISQPAVSKSVAALERELGTTLLDRTGRTTTLTDAGTVLLTRARELFAVEQSAEEELRSLKGLDGGVLRIAASTTIVNYLLSAYLARFRDAYPRVTLRVSSANTRDVARAMLGRRVDIALVEGPVEHGRLETLPWREDELVVIAHPDHPLARRRRLRLADLNDASFIVRERGSGTRRVAEEALAERDVSVKAGLELASTEAIKQAVAAGLGLAIVSRAAIADQVALGRIIALPVRDVSFARTLSELRFVGRAPSAAAVAFRDILSSIASDRATAPARQVSRTARAPCA